jgi:ATP-binding cassette subfamily F protein 3
MVNGVAELSRGQLTEYAGNYSFYLQERTIRREMQASSFLNQQKMIAETERFVERFRAKATKARQVQSRVKMLEKLERLLPPDSDEASISFRFPEPGRSGRTVIELSRFSKRYETREGIVDVFKDADPLSIERGDKVALIGRNGAGKSTLARMLAGTEPFKGDRKLGKDVDITFFAQHTADSLVGDDTVLEAVQRVAVGQTETQVRSMLGAFLFNGDDVFKRVQVLSGGERSRVALACTLVVPANFLLLDEPTNHLDIASISVLIEAMRQYSGTFAVVSHDRHFLDQVATRVWRVEDGTVHVYPGTYSEYLWRVRQEQEDAEQPKAAMARGIAMQSNAPVKPSKPAPAPSANQSKATGTSDENPYRSLNTFKLRKTYRAAEADILKQEARKEELEALLADSNLYADGDRARETREEYDAIQERLKEAYAKWETLADALADRADEK